MGKRIPFKRMKSFLFKCIDCQLQEWFNEREVPWGDPSGVVKGCDECGGRVVWTGEKQKGDLSGTIIRPAERADGPTVTVIEQVQPTLEEAGRIVGGYVQMLTLPDGSQLLVDEDGIEKRLPRNQEATNMLRGSRFEGQTLRGNALLLKGSARWK